MNEESLFVAALEQPTESERQAFLEGACAGNVALRQRVEQLLAAHLKTPGILDQPARPPEGTEVVDGLRPQRCLCGRTRRHSSSPAATGCSRRSATGEWARSGRPNRRSRCGERWH